MPTIKKIINECKKGASGEYTSGWRDAIYHVNDNYLIESRKNGETIGIVFNIDVPSDEMIKKIKELIENKQTKD